MTEFTTVYEAFLARVLENEWEEWEEEEAQEDWREIMEAAIPWFKFPRISLARTDAGFTGDLTQAEIQIIANYMKCEWLNRCIMTWQNVKPLYTEKDFSQANLIDKLTAMLKQERDYAAKMESIYYRSRDGQPFDFSTLATANGS